MIFMNLYACLDIAMPPNPAAKTERTTPPVKNGGAVGYVYFET